MENIQEKVLEVIYNCGGITKVGIERLGGDSELIKDMLIKKFIKKQPIEFKGKKIALYTITDSGERFYTDLTGKKLFFRCSRNEKIINLSYFYISNIKYLDKWINKDEWYNKGESGMIPDGTYFYDNKFYGVIIVKEEDKDKVKDNLKSFIEDHEIDQIKMISY